jgi:hypothetical protein
MNLKNVYAVEKYIADVYDQNENHLEDITLIKKTFGE